MKSIVALLLCSSVAVADENYSTNYDVTRTDKNVKYVFQISAQGSHTPRKILGLAQNPEEEAQYEGYITPLGIR